jgi:hypothetical protein
MIYLLIFTIAIVFLALFIILTMFDTMRRGDIDISQAKPFKEKAAIYDKLPADSTK